MSVSLQDVLALLPQIFPGVQQIPLGCIRPNPENPGPPITEDQIAAQALNLEASPLRNPIKVMPDPANPLAQGIRPHAENPNLKADGQPWAPADFNWVILSGELRYRAFGRLKREAIPAYVLNPSPEEVGEIIHQDNDVRDRGWFAAYQSIEQVARANPTLTQGQVAARLKMDRPKVNRALQLLPLLNPEARALACSNATAQNKGNWELAEKTAFRLAALGPVKDTNLASDGPKLWPYPAIPPETQDLVRRTLAVAIDHQMTQAGVKGLVAWVKAGNTPETFQKPHPPLTKGDKGGIVEKQAQVEPATATPTPVSAKIAGVVGALGGLLKTLHPKLKKAHQSLWPGVKSFLLSQAKRALKNMVRGGAVTGLAVLVVVLLLSPHLYVSLYHLIAGYPGASRQVAPPARVADSPQVAADSHLVQFFAKDFYSPDYTTMDVWTTFMEHPIAPIYRGIFYTAFYPPSKMEVIRKQRLEGSFQAAGPPQLLSSDKDGEEFLVQGKAGLQSNLKSPGQVVAEGPVALKVSILHSSGGQESKIVAVQETKAFAYDWAGEESKGESRAASVKTAPPKPVNSERPKGAGPVTVTVVATPGAQSAKAQGEDQVGKVIGDAAGEAAKKVLGF